MCSTAAVIARQPGPRDAGRRADHPDEVIAIRSTAMAEALPRPEGSEANRPALSTLSVPRTASCLFVAVSQSLAAALVVLLAPGSWLLLLLLATAPPSLLLPFPQEWRKYKYRLQRILRPPWKWGSAHSTSFFYTPRSLVERLLGPIFPI